VAQPRAKNLLNLWPTLTECFSLFSFPVCPDLVRKLISSLITHPLFDYKVSYRRALELQARLLAKTLTGEIPEYAPLLTR
jgi:CRISPR/Cas system-associated endonuclease Cas1